MLRILLLVGFLIAVIIAYHWLVPELLGLQGRSLWVVYAADGFLGLSALHLLSLLPHDGLPATISVEDGILRSVPHGLLAGRTAAVAVREIAALAVNDRLGLTTVRLQGGGAWSRRLAHHYIPGGIEGLLKELHQVNPDIELRSVHGFMPMP